MPPALNPIDVLTLVALARLGEDAYGVPVREEIASVTGREVSMAAVYASLDRLERQGLAVPWQSEPRPERGGRSRRHFTLTAAGRAALRAERAVMTRMWRGISASGEGRRR